MKVLFSIFFLLVMLTSVTVSVMEQWQGEDVSEVKESKSDDKDGEEKVETEKEVYTLNHNIFIETFLFSTKKLRKTNNYGNDSVISELYASLPELPPEA